MRALGGALVLACVAMACAQPSPSHHAETTAAAAPVVLDDLPAFSKQELDEAIAVRTRYGLRADLAWIGAVAAEPAAQVGIREYGIPLLPEELADLKSRRWDPDLHAQVRGYGLHFADDYAGAWINQKANGVIIAFKNQVDRHRTALSNLVPPGSAVEVRQVEWSLADLEGFEKRIDAEQAWFDSIGVRVEPSIQLIENRVDLRFYGPKDAGNLIVDRLENAPWLNAEWGGPPPWEGPRGDLIIEVVDGDEEPIGDLWVEYVAIDPMVDVGGATIFGTGDSGICVLKNFPAVAYRIRLHEWVDNDHYDPDPIKEFGVLLEPEGTTVRVVIPTP